MQAASLEGEFQDTDRVLHCWPQKIGSSSSAWQFVALFPRVFWYGRCTSHVVGENFHNTRSNRFQEAANVSWFVYVALACWCDGEISISMKPNVQNLQKACLTRERMKQLDDELSATESNVFRGTTDVCNR